MFLSQSQAGEGRQSQILSLPAVGGVRRVASKVKVKALLLVREGRHQSTETQRIAISFFTEVLANVFSFTEELQLSCYQLLLSLSPSCVSSLLGPVLAGVMRLSCSQDGTLAYLQEWLLSLAAAPHTATRHRPMELFFLFIRSSPLDCEAVLARREGGVPGFLSKVLG